MVKPIFDRIKSCSVLKFVLNPSRHCSLRPDLAFSFPAGPLVHAWPRCSRAPPAPLLPHGAKHRPIGVRLRCSRAAAGMLAPVLPLPQRGIAHNGSPHYLVLHSIKSRVDIFFFSAIAADVSSRQPASTPHQPPRR
jgi:hypothetical protein